MKNISYFNENIKEIKCKFFNFKKISIMKGFFVVCIIAFLSTLAIGMEGYISVKRTYLNLESLYMDYSKRVILLSNLSSTVSTVKTDMQNQLQYGNANGVDPIKKKFATIESLVKEYESYNLKSEDKDGLAVLNRYIVQYIKLANEILDETEKGKVSDDSRVIYNSSVSFVNVSIIPNINKLEKSTNIQLRNLYENSTQTYKWSIKIFALIVMMSLVLIVITTLIVMKSIKSSMFAFKKSLKKIAQGDFSVNIDTNEKSELGSMKKELAITVNSISLILKHIKERACFSNANSEELAIVSKDIHATMNEISIAIQEISKGATYQSEGLIHANNSFESFGNEIENIASYVKEVDENTKNINNKAQFSNSKLEALVISIKGISQSFDNVSAAIGKLSYKIGEINNITKLINGIAEKTNLLSLNASIEAARAGAAGLGFSVVANEIRNLSDQSKESATNINKLIGDISCDANSVVSTTNSENKNLVDQMKIIEKSISDFKEIIIAVEDIIPKISKINSAVENINKDKDEILKEIQDTARIAGENSATSEEIAASAEEVTISMKKGVKTAEILSETAERMIEEINRFKLKK
jgi:methyl-accepting chemotaxis protein